MDLPPPDPARAASDAARLATEISTPDGEKRIDDAMAKATELPEGRLFGTGSGTYGIAVDLETGEFLSGILGRDHEWAHKTLLDRAIERLGSVDSAEDIVVRGHAFVVPEYRTPLVLMYAKYPGDQAQERAEDFVLSRGYGIPVWPIKARHSSNGELREQLAEVRRQIERFRQT